MNSKAAGKAGSGRRAGTAILPISAIVWPLLWAREADDLLNRPFTDLISTETADGSATSERTLGFYLSSHVAFQDLIVRAKTKSENWWSISGRPDSRRDWALFWISRLCVGPDQDPAVGGRTRSSGPAGFAYRPRKSRSAAAGTRRRADQRSAKEASLLGVSARSRPLQGRQRYARTSCRRHPAPPRVLETAR